MAQVEDVNKVVIVGESGVKDMYHGTIYRK